MFFRDPVSKYVNAHWQPVDVATQRQAAVTTAVTALKEITAPNLAFGTPLSSLELALNGSAVKTLGVREVKLKGEDQLLRIDLDFERKFTQQSSDNLLMRLQPEVTGTLTMHAGITSATTQGDTAFVHLRVLPVLSGIRIDKVVVREKHDVTQLGQAIAAVLNDYAANISGELSRSSAMRVSIPTTIPDIQRAIETPSARPDIIISASPIQSPVQLFGVAWLVDDDGIIGMAQTVDVQRTASPAAASLPGFEELRKRFLSTFERSFDPPSLTLGPWAAIRRDLLANMTTSVVQQASVCINSNAQLPHQRVNEEIRFPDESTVDCTPARDCSPTRACDFPPQRDTRDCSRCILYRPGWPFGDGGCAQRGNDPVCEAAKAAQNVIYAADAAAKKADCERLKAQEKAVCELEKTGEKALCETGKELLKRLARTGKFARIEAGVRAGTDDLRVCLQRFRLSPELDGAEIGLHVAGSATAAVDLKFTPLDIVGHLTCQVPWTDSQTFRASLRESSVTVTPAIRLITSKEPKVQFTLPAGKVPLRLEPGPTEYLLKNVNMNLSCSGLNFVRPMALALSPFIPALRGEIDYEYEDREFTINLPVPRQQIGDIAVTGSIDQSSKALFAVGRLQRTP
jgi:hypothetical protein